MAATAAQSSRMDEQVFRALLEEFYLESKERLDKIEQVLLVLETSDAEKRGELLVEAKRELHTLKGNSGMMGLGELQRLAHQIEEAHEILHRTLTDIQAEIMQLRMVPLGSL